MKRPNVACGWAAGDLAVGGSTGFTDVAQSEDVGGGVVRSPDAPVGARPRNGAATAPLSPTLPPNWLLYSGINIEVSFFFLHPTYP